MLRKKNKLRNLLAESRLMSNYQQAIEKKINNASICRECLYCRSEKYTFYKLKCIHPDYLQVDFSTGKPKPLTSCMTINPYGTCKRYEQNNIKTIKKSPFSKSFFTQDNFNFLKIFSLGVFVGIIVSIFLIMSLSVL